MSGRPVWGCRVESAPLPGADLGLRAVGAGDGAAYTVGGANALPAGLVPGAYPAILVAGGILLLE